MTNQPLNSRSTPGIVFQPQVRQSLLHGVQQIVETVRPTLGPLSRSVVVSGALRSQKPEILDDAGLIARRITDLPDRDADMGAMLLRQMLWQLREQYGDGTATAAVLFETIFNGGARYVAAGGNPMLLRTHLEEGLRTIQQELAAQATPIAGKDALTGLAHSITADHELAASLGEVFDTLGEYALITIQGGSGRHTFHEFVQGVYWETGLHTREMVTDRVAVKTVMEDAAIFVSDLSFDNPQELVPVIEAASQSGRRALVIFASQLSANAAGLLLHASKDPGRFHAIAIKIPEHDRTLKADIIEDLVLCTGAKPFLQAAGDTAAAVTPADLGSASQLWADNEFFCIEDGLDKERLSEHLMHLETLYVQTRDAAARERIRGRIGRLMGASATLWIGGATDLEIQTRRNLAQQATSVMREAIRDGVMPGGGVAFLQIRPILRRLQEQASDTDSRAACRILADALEAPIRTILANAGYNPGAVLAEIERQEMTLGFDVVRGEYSDMLACGIIDSASVLIGALQGAVSTAALALTTEVLVHHRNPTVSQTP